MTSQSAPPEAFDAFWRKQIFSDLSDADGAVTKTIARMWELNDGRSWRAAQAAAYEEAARIAEGHDQCTIPEECCGGHVIAEAIRKRLHHD